MLVLLANIATYCSFCVPELNLSQNRLSALPSELGELTQLESVDLSHNSFVALPECLLTAPKLTSLDAKHNFIAEVDAAAVSEAPRLQDLDLTSNPVTRDCEERLRAVPGVRVALSQRETEDWEDLEI